MELRLPGPETVRGIGTRRRREGRRNCQDPSRHHAVGAALIEVTLRVRTDRDRHVRAHVDQTATDGEASSDHDVSKASILAN